MQKAVDLLGDSQKTKFLAARTVKNEHQDEKPVERTSLILGLLNIALHLPSFLIDTAKPFL